MKKKIYLASLLLASIASLCSCEIVIDGNSTSSSADPSWAYGDNGLAYALSEDESFYILSFK